MHARRGPHGQGEALPFLLAALVTAAALALPRLLAVVVRGGTLHGLRHPLQDYAFGVLAAAALLPTLRLWRGAPWPTLRWIWLAKVGIVLVAMPFYEAHYAAGLDAFHYHRQATAGTAVPFGLGTQAVPWLCSVLAPLVGSSYHALKVLFAYAGLAGVFLCVRAFQGLANRPHPGWLWAIALFPSILFWSSILGKEPLVLLGVGLAAWGASQARRRPTRASLLAMAAGLAVAALVRPWMAILMGLPLLAVHPWGLARGLPFRRQAARQAVLTVLVTLAAVQVAGAVVLPDRSQDLLDGPLSVAEAGHASQPHPGGSGTGPAEAPAAPPPAPDALPKGCTDPALCYLNKLSRSWSFGGSSQEPPHFDSWLEVVLFLPVGAFTAWFRPLPGEILSPLAFGLAAGLDNLALLAVAACGAWALRWRRLADPMVLFVLATLLLWSGLYAFLSYQNLGTAVRFKLQVEPLLLGLALLLWDAHRSGRAAAAPAPGAVKGQGT